MSGEDATRAEILQANRALRDWAEGLRTWSKNARDNAATQRHRAEALVRSKVGATASPFAEPLPYIDVHTGRDGLPCLDLIGVTELVDIVMERAGLSRPAAARAVHRGVLCAGYRNDSDRVTAADAFDIVEDAVRFLG
ncbi:hypothetical protein [Aeromicrobium sp. 179-A 4D2 NHS]|uniref:hypothetical protein n=1 Tax=Aeromicrobium sp. 179-A 4D2 NHS TaxID=3142375 RepID=UPI0039A25260